MVSKQQAMSADATTMRLPQDFADQKASLRVEMTVAVALPGLKPTVCTMCLLGVSRSSMTTTLSSHLHNVAARAMYLCCAIL